MVKVANPCLHYPTAASAMAKAANPFQSRRWRGRFSPFLLVGGALLMITPVVQIYRFLFTDQGEIGKASKNVLVESSSSFLSGGIIGHRETIEGRDVLWASPKDNPRDKGDGGTDANLPSIQGLLFLAHGCQHSSLDWFSKSPDCKDCMGLPEERAIVQTALDMGLVTIAMSSSNFSTKCWSGSDVTPVSLVLNELWHRFSQAQEQEESTPSSSRLPLYAFGASSGGAFVSSLAGPLQSRFGIHLDGFISQIAAQLPLLRQEIVDPHLCRVYVTMDKDERVNRAAQARVDKCQTIETGVGNKNFDPENEPEPQTHCKQIKLPSLPIFSSYFASRIDGISQAESEEMVATLRTAGLLDLSTSELIEDPRKSYKKWSNALRLASLKATSLMVFEKRGDALFADKSPIFEAMNVAWGFHEMTRDGVGEALEFCVAHQKRDGDSPPQ